MPDDIATQLSVPVPMTTVALSGEVDLDLAASRLPWPELRRYAYGRLFELPGGKLYLFGFGALTLDGIETPSRELLSAIEIGTGRRLIESTQDTYYIVTEPGRGEGARVGWDRVMVSTRSPQMVGAVALLLAQSSALERYEHAVDELVADSASIPISLAQRGRLPRVDRTMYRFSGRVISYRLELASLFYLVDRPEETWEDPQVAALYDALFQNLELKERHEGMLQKLQAVERATEHMISLWDTRLSQRLEWAIVGLIIVEIMLALFKLI